MDKAVYIIIYGGLCKLKAASAKCSVQFLQQTVLRHLKTESTRMSLTALHFTSNGQ